MKRKVLFTMCFAFIIGIISCSVAFAERFTECPVTLTASYGSSSTIEEFEIDSVENLYGEYKNRIYYTFDYTGEISLDIICYNAQGIPLQTLMLSQHKDYVDVPDTTAMIEIIPASPAHNSNTFFYCKYINAYSEDGRVQGIHELQAPIYKMVGWYPEIAVHADDGRTLNISPFQIEEYSKVGWYTTEVYIYRKLIQFLNEYKANRNYIAMITLVDEYVPYYEGTPYASTLYAIRTEAMDMWRNMSNSPLPSYSYHISEDSVGTPEANISFTNVSYKTIAAFKVEFTCYNIFGGVEDTYYDYYYCDDADMNPCESYEFTWTLYGAESVHSISNIRVTEVVFSDGTKWYR